MSGVAAFRLTQGFYWLFLGVWVGGMVMLVIGAAITFPTVASYKPTLGLPPYNHPALSEYGANILAGGITGNILKGLRVLQIVCAAVVAVCLVLQCTAFDGALEGGRTSGINLFRVALLALPVLILAVDACVLTPKIWELRSVMYNPEVPEATRQETRAEFQRYHKLDTYAVGIAALSLAAAVFASAFTFKAPTLVGHGVTTYAIAGKDVGRG